DSMKDHKIAGAILFELAMIGLACNLIVICFINSMPCLNNTFGRLTLSQAVVDSIHQSLMAFYSAPCIFYRSVY
ncbi:hypothetical protein PFISCL1PPCAC_12824, partial [Pristionchus fissidentatus]